MLLLSTLLSIPQWIYPPEQEPALQTPPSSAPAVTETLTLVLALQHNSPRLGGVSVPLWDYLQSDSQGTTPFKV